VSPEIRVDVHERSSGLPALLSALGATVVVTSLRVADYEVGPGALVERKQVLDLHGALVEGRLWSQLGRLRGTCRWPYLLIEGRDLDGPLGRASAQGACLAAVEQRIRVIRSFDREESAQWIYRLAARCQRPPRSRDRPVYSQKPKALTGREAAEALLAAVPGISTSSARALLARFGSVAEVINAGPDAWRHVDGIGEQRAAALHETVSARWRSQRAQDPST
jgi:DNA excision repair protein ERCC-4